MATPRSQSSLKLHHLPSNSSSSQVRVVLRVRPFLPSEIDTNGNNPQACISLLEPQRKEEVTVFLKDQYTSRNECYKLDSLFGQDDHVDQIFYKEVSKVIPGIFQGMNATIFAYGATGSGKTYTMQGTEEEPGLIPLAISTILSSCVNTEIKVEIAYYEVYMDRCYDLLEPKAKEIMALDDKDGQVQLKGLSWVEVRTMDEFRDIFSTGVQRRKVAHTGLNDVSSRSHGVLSIYIRNGIAKGKLNLIDLAGNEDNRRTGNDGIRLQESAKINQSLFALSNVIYALNNNEQRIPYRESKLTRILQDSLGGTSQALMVACLNPISYQEAVHTVSLAARSRHIVNYVGSASKKETPKEKIDMEAKLKAWLESKGKNKSVQRTGIFSPSSVRSSTKAKPKGRKLFDAGVLSSTAMEETRSCEVENSYHDYVLHDKEALEIIDPCQNMYDRDQDDTQRLDNPFPSQILDDLEDQRISTVVQVSKRLDLPDASCNKENLQSPMKITGSPLMSEKIQELRHSLRKVLSPIPSNLEANSQLSSDDRTCIVLLEPKTPKTTCDKDEVQVLDTPFDKFNALSSNLKDSLVRKYLGFLNVASKEELVRLKGIGRKRAEYILELRERNPEPLKSLSDLEEIGLSSKQVHNIVGLFRSFFLFRTCLVEPPEDSS